MLVFFRLEILQHFRRRFSLVPLPHDFFSASAVLGSVCLHGNTNTTNGQQQTHSLLGTDLISRHGGFFMRMRGTTPRGLPHTSARQEVQKQRSTVSICYDSTSPQYNWVPVLKNYIITELSFQACCVPQPWSTTCCLSFPLSFIVLRTERLLSPLIYRNTMY